MTLPELLKQMRGETKMTVAEKIETAQGWIADIDRVSRTEVMDGESIRAVTSMRAQVERFIDSLHAEGGAE